jgi:hypothetical protein
LLLFLREAPSDATVLLGPKTPKSALLSSGLRKENTNMLRTVLLILLILLIVGALPAWPYSTGWGYYPSGGLGLLLIIVLILLLL